MIPSYIKMFPEPADVFADKVKEHAEVLFPLFSIDLKEINPEWSGEIHMLQFNEDPYNKERVETFDDYCDEYMFGFDVIDGKYSFKTDLKYFEVTEKWKEWFEKTKTSYHSTKKRFTDSGVLSRASGFSAEVFEQIGGEPEWMQGGDVMGPRDPGGNPMTFISRVYSSNYTDDSCGKDIYMFYSHEYKLVVFLYQTT